MNPSPYVQDLIDSRSFGNLRSIPLFMEHGEELCDREFQNVCNGFSKVTEIVQQSELSLLEAPIRHDLESLAEDAIRELFGVPDALKISSAISNDFDDQLFEHDIRTSVSPELEEEINKRILLNCLCHGAAIHGWTSLHHFIKEEIDQLSPELMGKYDNFSRVVQMSLWQIQSKMPQIPQGNVDLNFEPTEIEVQGINLPVLLHELVKGVVSVWTAWGIPDLEEDEMYTLYAVADSYDDEYFHYLMGPALWRALIETLDVFPENLAEPTTKLSLLPYEQLSEVLVLCIEDPIEARRKLKSLRVI